MPECDSLQWRGIQRRTGIRRGEAVVSQQFPGSSLRVTFEQSKQIDRSTRCCCTAPSIAIRCESSSTRRICGAVAVTRQAVAASGRATQPTSSQLCVYRFGSSVRSAVEKLGGEGTFVSKDNTGEFTLCDTFR